MRSAVHALAWSGYRLAVREARDGLVAGRYTLGELLGRGGMGEVYQATDEVLGRQVAVKLMLPVPRTLAAPERFLREARATARIRSPHVVAAFDFGAHQDGYYLALELVSGHTVADELKCSGLFTPERAMDVVTQAAAGLAAAHSQGIVHRDIKPNNLLLTDDGMVKVADFGIVRFVHDTTTTLTSTGQIVGTSHYLSPERALGRPAEPASDVYSLGCVLYQLVTGRPPFTADTAASIIHQHVQDDATPPSELWPELAGDFESMLFWMLEKDPVRRPTAAQVADGVPPPVTADPDDETTTLPVRRITSKPVLAGAAAAFALAASATLGFLLETRGVDLPATDSLIPEKGAATTPAVVVPRTPATSRPVDPATNRPQTRSASEHGPSSNPGPGNAKADRQSGKSGHADKEDKSGERGADDSDSGPEKAEKPKH
jgi:eukaryotic-like serine/threonine-protein kinase